MNGNSNGSEPGDLLAGKTAVVIGGASGIGQAIAHLFLQQQATVLVGDFDYPAGSQEEDEQRGIECHGCDVRKESDVAAILGRAAELGGVDILVNSAGIGMVKPITDVSIEEWDNVLGTNLTGAFLASKHAIPQMQQSGGGVIINIASNAGILPRAHDPVYSISKHAIVAMTKSLALCHGKDNIRVNAICPGPVCDTRMMNAYLDTAADRDRAVASLLAASPLATAQQRMITPLEVAQSALYLASEAASMVSGTLIAIDGAKSVGVPPQ